jgi:hypothetical protein
MLLAGFMTSAVALVISARAGPCAITKGTHSHGTVG